MAALRRSTMRAAVAGPRIATESLRARPAVADGVFRRLRVHRARPLRVRRARDACSSSPSPACRCAPALAPLILLLVLLNVGYALSLFEVAGPDASR